MRRFICTVVFALAGGSVARADSLESFKKAIHTKWSAYRSIQYKIVVVSETDNPQMSFKSTTQQTVQYARQGDKTLSRVEGKTSTATKMGDMEQKSEIKTLNVSDGVYSYMYSESDGQKTASKSKIDPNINPSPFDGSAYFTMMEKNYTLKLMPDETVDGKPAYVLDMNLKDAPAGAPVGKTKLYFDKSSGVVLKSLSYDDKGKVMSTMTTSEIKLDAAIPPDRFVFKAPAGVTVTDETTQK